ncbi:MAG TPA: hypothetical protein H9850_00545 [Candidatus Anaerobiospirillum pullistercoris]|uniref:SprA-related family protein n=1 Tax=Candidatus Anaerobiospirillum pullistercoris TaxID=2838452 RepID=A0A9D2AZV2_9GAMM|nr:hypothetical protein [Candidatus Anaerobiospirillum pullistercoris]
MAGISSVQNFAPSVRTTTESKVDMQQIVSTGAQKATRVAGQSEENYVNLATSQISGSQQGTDEQYSHQRYIAYNAYINLGREQPLSPAEQFAQIQSAGQNPEGTDSTGTTQEAEEEKEVDPNTPRAANGEPLTEEEQAELQDMKRRDEEVRVHEQAHQSAGGQYTSAPHYEYENGPDGKRYVTDGSVNIDVGEESDPQATIDKMQVVKRAALAPAQPSAQDRRVYAEASQKEAEARRELNEQRQEEAAAAQGQGQEQSQAASATGSNAASTSGATGTNATGNNTTGNVIGSRQAQPQTASNQPQAQQTTPEGTPSSSSSSIPDDPDTPSKLSQSTLGSNRSDDDVPELV